MLRQAVEAAVPFVDKSFTDQPLIEARLRMTLGLSFFLLSKAKTAADHYQAARAIYAQHRGPDHPDTLKSMHRLADSYEALGMYVDALKLREETLALRKAKLGPDDPDTLRSMNSLANSYYFLGRQAEALKLREETLALMKAKLGPNDPDTLVSMNGLANSYAALGRYTDALKLNEETLARQTAVLGPVHPDTMISMMNLAGCNAVLGRHAEAVKLYEQALALQKAKLGPDHADTLMTMGNLADSLMELKRDAEALAIIDEFMQRGTGKDVDPRSWAQVIELRLRHFERVKDGAGCRQTAGMWEALKRTDADSLYSAALFRSVAAAVIRAADKSPAGNKLADGEADLAMTRLKQAVAAGYKDAAHMTQDKDLDGLRGREDFMKLLTELKAGPGVKK
jgi:tetratricopeptide (TPR) repeat protein